VLTTHNAQYAVPTAHNPSDYANNFFRISRPSNFTNIRTQASVKYSICYKTYANVLPKKWNRNIFHQTKLFQLEKDQRPNEFLKANFRWGRKRPNKTFYANEARFLKFGLKSQTWQPCVRRETPLAQMTGWQLTQTTPHVQKAITS